MIFVESAGADSLCKPRPDARRVQSRFEFVADRVPPVEVSDDGDGGGIRCPDGEMRAGFAFRGADQVRAQLLISSDVLAFAEEIDVLVC